MGQVPLLRTKLHIPSVRPGLVSRPRLIERLNDGLRHNQRFSRKLTLISAPAGFGKTTLVSDWVHRIRSGGGTASARLQAAWLSLDDGDNDTARFLTYIVAALQTLSSQESPTANIGDGVLGLLQSPEPPPTESILTALLNEITTSLDDFVMILDDHHLIGAKAVDDALSFLLKHLPPQMHLVIATREDPNLPLARLRVRGQLTELRVADLRFTLSESAEFFNLIMGLNLSPRQVASLETRTEGWIAGLQLAALALQGTHSVRGREDVSGFIGAFAGDNRYIVDYLVEEVLNRQPVAIQRFLLQTSILERLSGPLCDAVRFGKAEPPSTAGADAVRFGKAEPPSTAGTDAVRFVKAGLPAEYEEGSAVLEALERGNLFVVPLDDKRQWYRYHQLFADVLHVRLLKEQPDLVPSLHQRASEWYEHSNSPADAIRHALAAEDLSRAAGLAELSWREMDRSFQSATWLDWVRALPDDLVGARPVLSVELAWALLDGGELEAADAHLRNAERWVDALAALSEGPETLRAGTRPGQSLEESEGRYRGMVVVDEAEFRSLPVTIANARAYHAQAMGDVPATIRYAQKVLDLLPENAHFERGIQAAILGLAHWASGNLEAAHRSVTDGISNMRSAGNTLFAVSGMPVLADIRVAQGRLHAATGTYEQALQLATEQDEPMVEGTAELHLGLSEIRHEQGDLQAAKQHLLKSEELGEQVALPRWRSRWSLAQARIKQTQGDLDTALDLLCEAERLHFRHIIPDVRPVAALKARAWLQQGRLTTALSWACERGLSVDDDPVYLREFEHVTLARLLIAWYKSRALGLPPGSESGQSSSSIHGAEGLLARLLVAAEEGGRTASVIEILVTQALAYEALDDIPRALASVQRALALAEPEGYVQIFVDEGVPMARLLSEVAAHDIMPDYAAKLLATFEAEDRRGNERLDLSPDQLLAEPLTEREMEVLRLVAEGLSNREIGERLYLALDTVKGHNRNIFGKLAVRRRTEAVARARELGVL